MPSLRTLFAATLLGLCLLTQPTLAAELPSRSDVQSSLDGLADRKLPEAEQKALQKTYEQTLGFLEQADSSKKALTQLKAQLAAAPREITDAQREVTVMAEKSLPYAVLRKIVASCSAAEYTKVSLAVVEREQALAAQAGA